MSTTYDRPTPATLHVKLKNGETWEATADDLEKFGYVKRLDAYITFSRHLAKVLFDAGLIEREKDLTRTQLNPLRYIAELAICHPALLDHPENAETDAQIVAIERALRTAGVPADS